MTISKPLLCNESPSFAAAFLSKFKEGQEQTLCLPESIKVVKMFLIWLHGLPEAPLPEPCLDNLGWQSGWGADGRCLAKIELGLELFFFADKYQLEEMARRIIDFFHGHFALGCRPTLDQYAIVYSQTSPGSPLHQLFVDSGILYPDDTWLEKPAVQEWLQSEPEICTDFAVALSRKMRGVAIEVRADAGWDSMHKQRKRVSSDSYGKQSGRPWMGVTADRHGARNRGSWPSFGVWIEAEDEDERPFL